MTDQLILGIAIAIVALLIAYEAVETWRWRGFGNRPPSRFRIVRFVRRAIGGLVSIVTLRRLRTRRAAPEPILTANDDSSRLGDVPPGPVHLQPGRIVVSGARMPLQPATQPVQPIPPPRQDRPSRLRLVRDTVGAALVMGGFVVVFANLMPVTRQGEVEEATATPRATLRVVVVTPLPVSPSPLSAASPAPGDPTATPTPAPVSFVPTPTPAPPAKPTDRPAAQPPPRDAGSDGHPAADPEADEEASDADPQPAAQITSPLVADPLRPVVGDTVPFQLRRERDGLRLVLPTGRGQVGPRRRVVDRDAHLRPSRDLCSRPHVDGPGGPASDVRSSCDGP